MTVRLMIAWCVIGMGLAAAAIADLAEHRSGVAMIALANLGAVLSVMIVTADVLAMGLALVGLALELKQRRRWALLAFALAVLTKEPYLLIPLALAGYAARRRDWRSAAHLAMIPALPAALWAVWLAVTMPAGQSPGANIGWPFAGLFAALPYWQQESQRLEWLLLASTLVALIAGAVAAVRRPGLFRWVLTPWIVLACVAGVRVWGKPNNAARALAILWPLAVLAWRAHDAE
jgi:hypothetical protein